MKLLSKRRMLAIAATVDVALHARPEPVSAKALSGRFNLPARHFETILQALVKANILKGVRGPKGGYELARERRRISLADIVRATSAEDGDEPNVPGLIETLIEPALETAHQSFMAELEKISIADLCQRSQNESRATSPQADFTI